MLDYLIVIQIRAPADAVLFKFNVTIFHFDRILQNNATPIIIELIEYLVNEEAR